MRQLRLPTAPVAVAEARRGGWNTDAGGSQSAWARRGPPPGLDWGEPMEDNDSGLTASDVPWLHEQRARVLQYLEEEGVRHGGVGCAPAWCLAPILAVWRIESLDVPGRTGWWAISGDCPTDYLSGQEAREPREAVAAFARRWQEVSQWLSRGQEHPTVRFGRVGDRQELGHMLWTRADLLETWADDDEIW